MNLTCYVIDDEPHAIGILTDFISKTPGLELAGSSNRPLEALEMIAAVRPNVTFLDVDMPGLNGIGLAGLINDLTTVVFTTAFSEYGVEAFEKEAADYLLKPIAYERFLRCIQKIRKQTGGEKLAQNGSDAAFFVKTGIKGNFLRINIADIICVSGALNYVEIHLEGKKIITYLTLGEILEKLPAAQFSRIHKSHIVNHNFIRQIEFGRVKLSDNSILPFGPAFRQAFESKLSSSFLFSKREQD